MRIQSQIRRTASVAEALHRIAGILSHEQFDSHRAVGRCIFAEFGFLDRPGPEHLGRWYGWRRIWGPTGTTSMSSNRALRHLLRSALTHTASAFVEFTECTMNVPLPRRMGDVPEDVLVGPELLIEYATKRHKAPVWMGTQDKTALMCVCN